MKSVMLSIQPQHCENICTVIGEENGKPVYKKTVEVRKKAPKCDIPFKCYIYCTKGKVDKRGKHLHVIEPRKRKDYGVVEEWSNDIQDTLIVNGGYMAYESYLADGKVIGEFVCDRMILFTTKDPVLFLIFKDICLPYEELENYAKGKKLYGWHISDLKIYDKPKELGEFKRDCGQYGSDNPLCDDCKYYICCKGLDFDESDCAVNGYIPITRPPQSWCYVEEL